MIYLCATSLYILRAVVSIFRDNLRLWCSFSAVAADTAAVQMSFATAAACCFLVVWHRLAVCHVAVNLALLQLFLHLDLVLWRHHAVLFLLICVLVILTESPVTTRYAFCVWVFSKLLWISTSDLSPSPFYCIIANYFLCVMLDPNVFSYRTIVSCIMQNLRFASFITCVSANVFFRFYNKRH